MTSLANPMGQVADTTDQTSVRAFFDTLASEDPTAIVFYSAPGDAMRRTASIAREYRGRTVIGCSTAGEVAPLYSNGGVAGFGLANEVFEARAAVFPDLDGLTAARADRIVSALLADMPMDPGAKGDLFALLLIDGLSMREEQTTAWIHAALRGIPLVGGSAGDALDFKTTHVFHNGELYENAAVLLLVRSAAPFETFKLQHFEPSDDDVVVTESDASKRLVREINGAPAAEEYAEILGLETAALDSQVFAVYPLMLEIGGEWYVRSIQQANPDGTLTLFCAIDTGLPLTVARGVDVVDSLRRHVEALEARFSEIHITIGFDCILRKLEIVAKDRIAEIEALLRRIKFVGFSSYGEQFNSLHVNQTLTGVTVGSR